MVAVVVAAQFLNCLFARKLLAGSKFVYVLGQLGQQFLFGYAAYSFIFGQHADVLYVVQFAEYAELREFCYACEEHKAQVWVAIFQRTVETKAFISNVLSLSAVLKS